MSDIASRAEEIAAYLVGHALGATTKRFDTDGRQSAVDFTLHWPNGRRGALEVTLVTDNDAAAWQGMAAEEGWRWPAQSAWEFRLAGASMPYRRARRAVLRAVELCDAWNVDGPNLLPAEAMDGSGELDWLAAVGDLRRVKGRDGVTLLPHVRAEFVEAAPADFAGVVEGWLHHPHVPRHVEKARNAVGSERHLFLVAVDEVLSARFFTNDFAAPMRCPEGFGGLDGVWVWSNYWHQYLVCRGGTWKWLDFPAFRPAQFYRRDRGR